MSESWLSEQTFKGGIRVEGLDVTGGVMTLSIQPGADVDRIIITCSRLPGEAGVLERDLDGRPTRIRVKMKAVFSERADPKTAPPLGLDG